MGLEKREQVFVSSTFRDLSEERQAVIRTLLEADCIPSGMEMFPASDEAKFDLIKRVIDLCDYYVVIIGGRYGSTDGPDQVSYTEMEFDYAVSRNRPVLAFLHWNPGKIEGEKLDRDPVLQDKLEAFRSKAETRMVKYWRDSGDLSGQVALAIMQIRKTHPAEGWVRAGDVMTPETKSELAQLRARVAELVAQAGARSSGSASLNRSDLAEGSDVLQFPATITFHWKSEVDSGTDRVATRRTALWTAEATCDEVLRHLGPELMDEAPEKRMRGSLSRLCLDLARKEFLGGATAEATDDDDEGTVGAIYEAHISTEGFNDVKVHLTALGLIEKGKRRRPGSDTQAYWVLTDKGLQQLLTLRATRKALLTSVDVLPPNDEAEDA